MDLHGIVADAIDAVNPFVTVTIRRSNGYTAVDFRQVPAYFSPVSALAQVQPISTEDLQHVEGLNIQGVHRTIFIEGAVAGLIRASAKGGDLVTLPDATIWLVSAVPEQWPDWCHAIITMQDGA